jgi:hypothetical protein
MGDQFQSIGKAMEKGMGRKFFAVDAVLNQPSSQRVLRGGFDEHEPHRSSLEDPCGNLERRLVDLLLGTQGRAISALVKDPDDDEVPSPRAEVPIESQDPVEEGPLGFGGKRHLLSRDAVR